ncbi:hypothetical protein A9G45_02585 [Gilliamella sp. HK2]|uniref:hypothetical protein n=1 Tax=unclassified Gilliamella TaxID=2685620 RepID=UPI00080E1BE2|nr:hypothetical protein [Gilliamella apicola]OCG24198.1 hypothetical protein A9G46_09025 [Gilliamella apicola]OCG30591.1 hypothetical protein A9G45_02585 [Gilliamella apicola]
MSLEQAITENTATMRELIAAMKFANFGKLTKDAGQEPQKMGQTTEDTGQITANLGQEKTENARPLNEPEPTPTEPQPEKAPDKQEAIRCLMDLAKKERTRAVAVLAQFRVGKASELKEDQISDFIAAVNAQLDKLEGK